MTPSPGPGRLLLISGDDARARYLTSLFASRGYAVEHAGTRREAIASVAAFEPDVILAAEFETAEDEELIAALRRRGALDEVPIIVLSADLGEEHAVGALTRGADDYLTRPFNPLELVARVERHLKAPRSNGRTAPHVMSRHSVDELFLQLRDLFGEA